MWCPWINPKPFPSPRSLEKLSSVKSVPGPKRAGDHCFKRSEPPLLPLFPEGGFHDCNPVSAKVTFPSQHRDFAVSSPPLLRVVKDGFFFFPFLLLDPLLFSPTAVHLLRAFSLPSPLLLGPSVLPFPLSLPFFSFSIIIFNITYWEKDGLPWWLRR